MNTCPRCFSLMEHENVRNALSRTDNKTYICATCGQDEGFEDAFGLGVLRQNLWCSKQFPYLWRELSGNAHQYSDTNT